jgi:hypothetical protein
VEIYLEYNIEAFGALTKIRNFGSCPARLNDTPLGFFSSDTDYAILFDYLYMLIKDYPVPVIACQLMNYPVQYRVFSIMNC